MLFFLLVACIAVGVHEGTAVGNPTDLTVALAEGKGLTWQSASVPVATLGLVGCDGSAETMTVGRDLDLLGDTLVVPPGEWCELDLAFDGELHAVGLTEDQSTIELRLPVGEVVLGSTTAIDPEGGAFYLELADRGWVKPQPLGATDGAAVTVGPDGTDAEKLVREIEKGSRLYVDRNADGRLDEDERAVGAIAGDDESDSGDDHGSGDSGG